MERETRGCFGDAGLRRRANRAVKPNGPVTGGGRVGGKGPIPARPHPKPSNSRRHLDYLTMRGGGRVRGAGARLPGSAQSARGARAEGGLGQARTPRVGRT